MKSFIYTLCLLVLSTSNLFGQDLSVPDSILNELSTVRLVNTSDKYDTLVFKIVFPPHFQTTKSYPVQLCLSGGNQSEKIVNYCYAAWFRSAYFKNHLTIIPIAKKGENLRHYSANYILQIINTIRKKYKTKTNNWILCGTSNGGLASFNFAAASPELYEGIIAMPGILKENIKPNKNWKHLKVVLSYGEKEDEQWIKRIRETKSTLAPFVKKVSDIKLTGQGHILPIGFDIDQVYRQYFEE